MKFIKYMPYHNMVNASRNHREIDAALEYGFDVEIFSNDYMQEQDYIKKVGYVYDGEKNISYDMIKMNRIIRIITNRIIVIYNTFKLSGDVWSCHDLKALSIAFFVTRFKKKKPKLIYDSHEFEMGRFTNRNKLQSWYIEKLEKFLINNSDLSMMVNDSIAEEVKNHYKLQALPIVIRSTPEKWKLDKNICLERRAEILGKFRSQEVTQLVMFHGNLGEGNGIEQILKSVKEINYLGLVLMGNKTSHSMYNKIDTLINEYEISDRVLVIDAVKYSVLWEYIGAMDLELMPINPISKSYELCLPNKLFESIQSLTPVITSNLPEMEKIVLGYEIGMTCIPNDAESLIYCISYMMENKEFYSQCKNNLIIAKEKLCWEHEKEKLFMAYDELFDIKGIKYEN